MSWTKFRELCGSVIKRQSLRNRKALQNMLTKLGKQLFLFLILWAKILQSILIVLNPLKLLKKQMDEWLSHTVLSWPGNPSILSSYTQPPAHSGRYQNRSPYLVQNIASKLMLSSSLSLVSKTVTSSWSQFFLLHQQHVRVCMYVSVSVFLPLD